MATEVRAAVDAVRIAVQEYNAASALGGDIFRASVDAMQMIASVRASLSPTQAVGDRKVLHQCVPTPLSGVLAHFEGVTEALVLSCVGRAHKLSAELLLTRTRLEAASRAMENALDTVGAYAPAIARSRTRVLTPCAFAATWLVCPSPSSTVHSGDCWAQRGALLGWRGSRKRGSRP